MNLNLVVFCRFLFETGRRLIPSCCQHDERAITELPAFRTALSISGFPSPVLSTIPPFSVAAQACCISVSYAFGADSGPH